MQQGNNLNTNTREQHDPKKQCVLFQFLFQEISSKENKLNLTRLDINNSNYLRNRKGKSNLDLGL